MGLKTRLRRWSRLMALCFCLVGLAWFTIMAHAEYGQGIGEIGPATAEASAKLNDALTEFHAMLAALDRGQTEDAERHRTQVLARLQQAANAYEGARPDAHTLRPSVRTVEERQFVEYFIAHAAEYRIALPTTQSDLIFASSRLVRELASRIAAEDLSRLRQETIERQLLANFSADVQKFLISATSMLILG
jgi:hypothetical protein